MTRAPRGTVSPTLFPATSRAVSRALSRAMSLVMTRALSSRLLNAIGGALAGAPGLSAGSVAVSLLIAATAGATAAPRAVQTTWGKPSATIDLRTTEGAGLVGGTWRWSEARIVEIDSRGPGPDLKASGAPVKTRDISPRAGGADYDDSSWEAITPESLEARRSTGRLSFCWYRINVTIPARIGEFDPTGSTAVFEIVLDDYAEVWVDGKLPLVLGKTGGDVVGGFNTPNRVVIAREARPGQKIEIAVFGANGPLSDPPANFIWVRSAAIDFYRPSEPAAGSPDAPVRAQVLRVDPAIDGVVPPDATIEKLADGFGFTEGPVWVPDGYLLFSDPNNNTIWRWAPGGADGPGHPDGELSIFRVKSGYSGGDIGLYGQPGSNGLTLDPQGRLTIDEHGNRRVTRLERNGTITVLADRYEGKRLNSPNDLVYRSDGTLYFTDPPFGLPRFHDDPRRELPYTGVYMLREGALRLVSDDLTGPNGIAFAPDEKYLYVSNWDVTRKVIMRYEVAPDGSLSKGAVFFDMKDAPGEEALDGLKVDEAGNVYASGPGGLWIISPAGKHLGTIVAPELPANFAWGDADGRTLYLTARTGLYRIRLGIPGAGRPGPRS